MSIRGRAGWMAAALLLGLVAGACQGQPTGQAPGSGGLRVEARPVSGFDSVNLARGGELTVVQGDADGLVIQAGADVLPQLTSVVRGGKLLLDVRPGVRLTPTPPVRYQVTMRRVRAISAVGPADVETSEINTDRLDLVATGSTNLAVPDLTAAVLHVTASGPSLVTVAGNALQQEVSMGGRASYDAGGLTTEITQLDIQGAGSCRVEASERLDITLVGTGDVTYSGSPAVTERITGTGAVTHRSP